MKTLLVTDHLTERDPTIEILEFLAEMLPDAPIYTYAHKQGGILGPVEQRKIYSSYLSNFVASEKLLKKWAFLLPQMHKKFSIPPKIDYLFCVSRGFGHGMVSSKAGEAITYIYSWDGVKKKSGILSRLFSAYTQSWASRELRQQRKLIVSSTTLKNELVLKYNLDEDRISVVPPFFPVHEFVDRGNTEECKTWVVSLSGLSQTQVKGVLKIFSNLKEKFFIVGIDHRFSVKNLFSLPSNVEFWGDRCRGELAWLISNAKGVLSFENAAFPELALAANISGRPVIVNNSKIGREFLVREGALFLDNESDLFFSDLSSILNNWSTYASSFKISDAKRNASRYSSARFRRNFEKAISETFSFKQFSD